MGPPVQSTSSRWVQAFLSDPPPFQPNSLPTKHSPNQNRPNLKLAHYRWPHFNWLLLISDRDGNPWNRPLGLPHGPHWRREDVPTMVKYYIFKICIQPWGGTHWRTLWSTVWSCWAWSSAPPPSSMARPCIAHHAYQWVDSTINIIRKIRMDHIVNAVQTNIIMGSQDIILSSQLDWLIIFINMTFTIFTPILDINMAGRSMWGQAKQWGPPWPPRVVGQNLLHTQCTWWEKISHPILTNSKLLW